MSRITTQIDVPRRVLGRKHGLWTSAYHLIHPADGSAIRSDDSGDELMIFPSPYIDFPSASPNGMPITQDGGIAAASRIVSGLSFGSDCGFGYSRKLFCPPGVDCSELEDGIPGCQECESIVEYIPTFMESNIVTSTFNLASSDAWARLEQNMIRHRENFLEDVLWQGDVAIDGTDPMNLYNFVTLDPAENVEVLGDDVDGETAHDALVRLISALGSCLGDAAGMIHAPIDVVALWMKGDLLKVEYIDYGDGMGEREVLVTKIGGHVVVAGANYSGLGPQEDDPASGLKWTFGTSMVYLIWDKISVFPERGNISHARFATNDIVIDATQMLGAFYDPCCTTAVLVDTTA